MKKRMIYTLLLLMPVIDLITSLQVRNNISSFSFGMLLKGILIIMSIFYIFIFSCSKYKRISMWYIFLSGIFIIFYFLLKPELTSLLYFKTELKYLFRIFYMPIMFCFFLNVFDEIGFDKKIFIKIFCLLLLEFTILLLVPLLLNTAFKSYSTGLNGYVGWFFAANEISVVMLLLMPFMYYLFNKKYNFFVSLPVLYVMSAIGTKVTLMGTIIIAIVSVIYFLMKYNFKFNIQVRSSIYIFIFTIIIFGFINNIAISNLTLLQEKQNQNIIQPITTDENLIIEDAIESEPKQLPKIIKLFLSTRDEYFYLNKKIYDSTYQKNYKFFGMGFAKESNINKNTNILIEIDYLDLYFRTGIIGLLLVILPYIYVGIKTIIELFKGKLKEKIILSVFYNSIIVCLALGIAAIAGHILFYPAVSIYLAFYLIFILNEIGIFKKDEINENKVSILALHLKHGGIETVIVNQANMLSSNYDVEIISLYKTNQELPYEINKNIKITYLMNTISNKQEIIDALNNKKIISLLRESIKSLKILYLKSRLIKKAIINSDAKVIISSRGEFSKILGKHHRENVVTISEEHVYHNNNVNYISKVIKANENVDYLLPTSKELTEFYQNKVKANVVYIKNTLNFYPEYLNSLKAKKLLAIGRLSKEKGFTDLIDVMNLVVKQNRNITLDIYGDGEEKENIIAKIKEYKLENSVFLKGFVSQNELNKIRKNYDLILCTSYEESFGLGVLESMAFGIPCVTFDDAKGLLEFVNDNNGIIITNRNIEKMANSIIDLLNNYNKLKKFGENARIKSEEYAFDNVKKEFNKFILQSINLSKTINKKVMFISSSGGHFNELMQLKSLFNKYNYQIITEKTNTNEKLKNKYIEKIHFLIPGTRFHPISYYLFILPLNSFISLLYYIKYHPSYIITTGSHTAGPMCCIGKIFGSKIVFIESFANIHSKTATGKIIYHFADLFIVQWESMLELYPDAVYGGWIF